MSVYDKIRGTIETLFQLGLGGPNLKNNTGVVELRNAADVAFVKGRGAPAVGADDFVTFAQAGGAAQEVRFIISGATGAGTTDSATSLPAGSRVIRTIVDVTVAFDGGGTISVGTAGSAAQFQATTDNLATAIGTYMSDAQDLAPVGAPTAVRATKGGAPTVGAATIIVLYTVPLP